MNSDNNPRKMPGWEKIIWAVIILYLIAVFVVFWFLGFSKLAFPI